MPAEGPNDSAPGASDEPTARLCRAGQKLFGRFTLQRLLGRGGMGVVWLAHDDKLDREVALKFLPEQVQLDAAAMDALKLEARKCLELTHPHVVRIHDFVEEAGSAAISMEYVDGPTLTSLRMSRERKLFEPGDLAEWLQQLCAALDYAHLEARVAHRDLKPSNLMVNSRGKLKITDFGISRSLQDSVNRLTHQTISGTLLYMSPQQLNGEAASPSDDIYSLGATLYELLTTRPPFYSGDVGKQMLENIPPTVAGRRAEFGIASEPISEHWEHTIAACLAKDPAQRPQSAGEVVARLGIVAIPVSSVPRRDDPTRALVQHRPRPRFSKALVLGFSVFALVGAGTTWLLQRNRGPQVKEPPAAFTNSLGMRFEPVPGTEVLFSIWETRVQDYEAFVKATGQVTRKLASVIPGRGETFSWNKPGFPQTPRHPVAGVNWQEAQAFCRWLTESEWKTGRIGMRHHYRLPTIQEWRLAAGMGQQAFTWGDQWPPPANCGNFAGTEVAADAVTKDYFAMKPGSYLPTNRDEFVWTAPVGSFSSNLYNLFDMGGNLEEWYTLPGPAPAKNQGVAGGAWVHADRRFMSVKAAFIRAPTERNDLTGFRCVLAPVAFATNGLDMVFVPVPGTDIQLSIWETRVQDYEKFVNQTGYVPKPMLSHTADGMRYMGHTWKSPGFTTGPTHPVCGVSLDDARAFCSWLTQRERDAGRINGRQTYRLLNHEEWKEAAAAASSAYAWGEQWPPPVGYGNFAGEELLQDPLLKYFKLYERPILKGYSDGFARTAPVGSFPANGLAIYDLVGNVSEWFENLRGTATNQQAAANGSWTSGNEQERFDLNRFRPYSQTNGWDNIGFRCALAPVPISTNSLGMVSVPVPGTNVKMSIRETRMQDFEAFDLLAAER